MLSNIIGTKADVEIEMSNIFGATDLCLAKYR